MRTLLMLLVLVVTSFAACTSGVPTADNPQDDAVADATVAGKTSESAAGVIRYDTYWYLYFIDPVTGIEVDYFDTYAWCVAEADPALLQVQVIYKEDLKDDPDDWYNDRLIRLRTGDDLVVTVSSEMWWDCGDFMALYNAGKVAVGTGSLRSFDNDVYGWTDRNNANVWNWTGHGQLMTPAGETRILNFFEQCVWVDEYGPENCRSKYIYK